MSTLHLNLTKKWFDMILSGEKKVEYREIKTYWFSRLFFFGDSIGAHKRFEIIQESYDSPKDFKHTVKYLFESNDLELKPFKTITFSNGMKPIEHLRRFEINFQSLKIDKGIQEWGAEKNEFYFCLHLGEIVHKHNC